MIILKGLKSFDQFLNEKIKESLVISYDFKTMADLNGGAFGHLSHLYEDLDLTFGDLKEIVEAGLRGELNEIVEKTDGQALSLSFKDGRIIYARNKGQFKNFGANALDSKGIKEMFAGRGTLSEAYNFAIDDLESALLKLPTKELNAIFNEGEKFMHLEVMYTRNQVTVPYGAELLVFHNVSTYDKDGELMVQDRKSADKLAKMIKDVNAEVQKTFKIQGSPYVDMKVIDDFDKKKSEFFKKINEIEKKVGLIDTSTLGDYYEQEFEKVLKKERPGLNEIERIGLVRRWVREDKSFRLDKSNLELENIEWAKDFEKSKVLNTIKEIRKPIELFSIELGIEIIKNIKTFLTVNPDQATESIKRELDKAINDIKSGGDESAINKMERHLERLQSFGMDQIFPTEGVIFQRGNQLYKLTGTFADVHHIIGILKFGR